MTRNDVVEYLSLIFKLGNVLIGAKQEDDIKERFSAIFSDQNVNEKNGLLARDGLLARTDLATKFRFSFLCAAFHPRNQDARGFIPKCSI